MQRSALGTITTGRGREPDVERDDEHGRLDGGSVQSRR